MRGRAYNGAGAGARGCLRVGSRRRGEGLLLIWGDAVGEDVVVKSDEGLEGLRAWCGANAVRGG